MREIAETLAGQGQYLPFDPMLLNQGATLGGTVAAGLSGPGRFRFGGLRDFILGVRFVDGTGRLLRMGGKVVKNAAGFDLPKFFAGSLGRFGVLAEITFKVFPRPPSSIVLRLAARTLDEAVKILTDGANSRFEFDALDLAPAEKGVLARLAGPAAALDAMTHEIFTVWPGERLSAAAAESLWSGLREFRWSDPDAPLVKVALSPSIAVAFGRAMQSLGEAHWHLSAGGNLAFVSLSSAMQAPDLDQLLQTMGLAGVALRGPATMGLWFGPRARPAITAAVKRALDPTDRFPSLDD
jgi:glycolate oxidase FAD binding subunit